MHTVVRQAKCVLAALFVTSLVSGCGSDSACLTTTAAVKISACSGGTPSAVSGHSVSGGVNGISPLGVLFTLTGAATANVGGDANGTYSFNGLADGRYTVTPSRAGYTFNPVNVVVTISGANVAADTFTATAVNAPTSDISGTVSGAAGQDVTVTLSGANTGTVFTDANGNYSFSGLAAGGYTVTPSIAGYVSSPASTAVTIVSGQNVVGVDFMESVATARIFGSVSGGAVQNVTITLSGVNTGSAVTDANGKFSFTGLVEGNYTVTPSLAGYIFTPASTAVTTSRGEDVILGSFAKSAYVAATFSLSGTVGGAVAQNVTITLSGTNSGTVFTDAGGSFKFPGLASGTYTVTPSLAGYTFTPASRTVSAFSGGDISAGNFTAAP